MRKSLEQRLIKDLEILLNKYTEKMMKIMVAGMWMEEFLWELKESQRDKDE